MASHAVAIEQDRLIEVVQEIMLRNLPRWLQEVKLENGTLETHASTKMTYAEFLDWKDEDTLAEWEHGEVIMSSPASLQHQNIGDFLNTLLQLFVEHHDLGVMISAPFQMKLENGREPDLLYVASAHVQRLHETYLEGPADLSVEIVSPESLERDRGTKFVEYEAGGVPEYWLIDPLRRQVECYQLDANGHYTVAFSGGTGIYHSVILPGFWLRIEWLWQQPLPNTARTAWEIIGLDGLRQLVAELEQQGV
jgi:Uma2 family endonuclease